MARPRKNAAHAAKTDFRKFAGKSQKTDFSFLKDAFPQNFGNMVFRLITDDDGGSRHFEYMDRGWEEVTITPDMAEKDKRLRRFIRDKGADEGSVIRIPVNPNTPQSGKYGVLMMKSKAAFEQEERMALKAEVNLTEEALRKGQDNSGVGGIETYAADTGDGKTQGFRKDLSSTLG